jgi:DNA-binding transcriptional MocR family regulator
MSETPQTLARPLAKRVTDLPPPPAPAEEADAHPLLAEGAIAALADGKTKYTDRPGIIGLRRWVANHLNSLGNVNIEPNQVTITCGVDEARFVAVTYLAYDGQTNFAAKFDTLSTEKVISLEQHSEQSNALLDGENGQHIIWDMSQGTATVEPITSRNLTEKTLFIGTFPGVGDGWRVGWMAGHADHAKIRSYKQSMTICTPSASQWAVLKLLEGQS